MGNDNSIRKASVCICIIAGILIFLPRTLPTYTNPWMLLQWNVNYDNGFIYRGLLGTILQSFIGSVTSSEMIIIGTISTIIYYLSLCLFMFIIMKNLNSQAGLLLLILFVSQSFITQWYLTSSMFGRLDVVLNVLFYICIVLSLKLKSYIYLPVVIILSILGMIIHEGYAIYSIPTLFAVLMVISINKHTVKSTARKLAIFLLPCILTFIIIIHYGQPAISQEVFYSYVSNNILEVAVTANDVYSIYYMPIAEKIMYTLNKFTLDKTIHLIATIILMIPTIYVSASVWKCIISNSNREKKCAYSITILLSFSTTIAYLIAVDTMRWLGYIVINNFVVLLVVYAVDKEIQDKINSKIQSLKYIIIIACILSVVLGPTQWMKSYTIVDKVYNIISDMLIQ